MRTTRATLSDQDAFDDFVFFQDELEDVMAVLMPDVRVEREGTILVLSRDRAVVVLEPATSSHCQVVMRFRGVVVLREHCPLVPDRLAELRADIIGFFCGAPLQTFSVWPRKGPEPVLPPRRRRSDSRRVSWWSNRMWVKGPHE
ncbi:MAG TPA: hypothetical protein VFB22_11345 [Candidatus Baltobacteraceae bacterium]|nr:hypothetical protein [Candidatus Baltobacteraceae bacterium]